MHKEDLERVIKEKINPLIEEAMQQHLGMTISELEKDITLKLEQQRLIGFTIRTDLPFAESKHLFKKEFLERTIQTHYGNISEVADIVGLDRRSIHRDIKSLKVDIRKVREKLYKHGYFEKEAVDGLIRNTLEHYRSFIHPDRLGSMYSYVPELSESIVKVLSVGEMKWKEAEMEFERAYLAAALKESGWSLRAAAKKIKIRYETLLRKMKKLGLRR